MTSKLHIISLPIKKVEEKLNIKLRRGAISLGLDCALTTGYAIARTDRENLYINVGFIKVQVPRMNDKEERLRIICETFYRYFMDLIEKKYITVVEDVYLKWNPQTTMLLNKIGTIAWTIAKFKGCKRIIRRTALKSRVKLGLTGNAKKPIVMQQVNEILGTNLENSDEIDSIVLAINGLCK